MQVWTSAEGTEWSPVGSSMDLGRFEMVAQVVGLPGRLVAIGGRADGNQMAVWIGEPGG